MRIPLPAFLVSAGALFGLADEEPSLLHKNGAGAHWQRREIVSTGPQGPLTNRFIQLETGLNYRNSSGQWVPANPQIDLLNDGAIARYSQHTVRFAPNANTQRAIEVQLPGGRSMVSHVYGLAYYDSSTGEAVLVAEIKDSQGWLYPPNQLIYSDAFKGVAADLRYLHSKSGIEQDIILREAPPMPEAFGLNPKTTRLEVWTEFLSAPEPKKVSRWIKTAEGGNGKGSTTEAMVDETLDFGTMSMVEGRAFALGEEDDSLALVAKQWIAVGDRRFLVETVDVAAVEEALEALPPSKGGAQNRPRFRTREHAFVGLPAKPGASQARETIQVAPPEQLLAMNQQPGLVLDYSLTGTINNFTSDGTTSYLVTGPVTFGGTNTTIAAGTIFRFAPTNNARLTVSTPVTWLGELYRPVILTAADDPVFGHTTNAMTGYYAQTALEFITSAAVDLRHLRVVNARTAIAFTGTGSPTISHAQFVNCETGLRVNSAVTVALRNALFHNVLTNFSSTVSTGAVRGEHLTVQHASWLNAGSALAVTLTNSLLAAVTNTGTYTGVSTAVTGDPVSMFTTAGGGRSYLVAGSTNRNAGVTNIHPALLNELRDLTTTAPVVYAHTLSATNLTLGPVVPRDTDQPDRGYHYAPIDYAVRFMTVTNANLGLTNGVVIAGFGSEAVGLRVVGSGNLCAQGTPLVPIRFTRPHVIQEQPEYWGGKPAGGGFVNVSSANTGSLGLRFCRFDYHATIPYNLINWSDGSASTLVSRLLLRDCEAFNAWLMYYGYTPSTAPILQLVNNLVEGGYFSFGGAIKLDIRNQTSRKWTLDSWPAGTTWSIQDNVFDDCLLIQQGSSAFNSHNAYVNGTEALAGSLGNDLILPSFTWQSVTNGARIGRYYPVAPNLLDRGSRTADQTRLRTHTVLANQAPEGTNTVDLGYHYVAFSGAAPLDLNANGTPDYREHESSDCGCDIPQGCANLPPSIALVTPTFGQLYLNSRTNVAVQVAAYDVDGTISSVQVFTNGVLASTLTSSPYFWSWDGMDPGTYTVSARAWDNGGASSATGPVPFTVNASPQVTIVSPTNVTTFAAGSSVTIRVQASDPDGTVANVALFRGPHDFSGNSLTNPISTALNAGFYEATLVGLTNGSHVFYARAMDNRGGQRFSQLAAFRLVDTNTFPTVTITSPSAGSAAQAGTLLEVRANAVPPPGSAIQRVEFYANDRLIDVDPHPPYAATYLVEDGEHDLVARAVTTATPGRASRSGPVRIMGTIRSAVLSDGFWETSTIGSGLFLDSEGSVIQDLQASANGFLYSARDQWHGGAALLNFINIKSETQNWANVDGRTAGYSNVQFPELGFGVLQYNNLIYGASKQGLYAWNGSVWSLLSTEYAYSKNLLEAPHTDFYHLVDPGFRELVAWRGDVLAGGSDRSLGTIQSFLGRVTNQTLVSFDGNVNGPVRAICAVNDSLYIGGDFTAVNNNGAMRGIARLRNGVWEPLGTGVGGGVWAIAPWRGGVIVGGIFSSAGSQAASSIAHWNGTNWASMSLGVSGSPDHHTEGQGVPAVGVFTATLNGNSLYFGGRFANATDSQGTRVVRNVAEATWDDSIQAWRVRAMDGGVSVGSHAPVGVHSIVTTTNSWGGYDVIVGGAFRQAGNQPAANLARWRVGAPKPANGVPVVSIERPVGGTNLASGPISVLVSAQPSDSSTRRVTSVSLYANNELVESQSGYPLTDYGFTWSPSGNGPYELWAVASEEAISDPSVVSSARSLSVFCQVTPGGSPLVRDDSFPAVASDGQLVTLDVLANDQSPTTRRITGLRRFSAPGLGTSGTAGNIGSARIRGDGQRLEYTPTIGAFGRDVFYYDSVNGGVTSTAAVLVELQARPRVVFTQPASQSALPPGAQITISGSATVGGASVTSVQLYTNQVAFGPPASASFSRTTPPCGAGPYLIQAVATSSTGLTSTNSISVAVGKGGADSLPQAQITSVSNSFQSISTFNVTNYPVLREGSLVLSGNARDPDAGDYVSYTIVVRRPDRPKDAPLLRFVPPGGTLDAEGYRVGSVTGGILGTLYLDQLPNGVYDLELTVRGADKQVTTAVRVALDSGLKLGRLSFTEEDAVVQVSGLPLRVLRTYDSFKRDSGDFGPGWTHSIVDLDVRLDEERQAVVPFLNLSGTDPNDLSQPEISVRSGGGYNVTLDVPGGERTTFVFAPRRSTSTLLMYAEWAADPRTGARLVMPEPNGINFFVNGWNQPCWEAAASVPFERYDIPKLELILRDQTKFTLERGPAGGSAATYFIPAGPGSAQYVTVQPRSGPFRLTEVAQPSGDRIWISPTEIRHQNTTNSLSRRLAFIRDDQDRITELRDPIQQSGGAALVRYLYNDLTGNLVQVERLVGTSPVAYVTNRYHYEDPRFPHYLTGLETAAGVTRNYYDEAGRLSATVDALGFTNRFVHDTTNRIEIVIDRLGATNSYAYDSRGNVVRHTDAQGGNTFFGYDNEDNQVAVTNSLNVVTRIGYDSNRLPTAVTNAFGSGALEQVTRSIHDSFGRLVVSIDPLGRGVTNTYSVGNLLQTVSNSDGLVLSNSYDTSGRLRTSLDAAGAFTTNEYDTVTGDLTRTVSGWYSGNTWVPVATNRYFYDANGRQVASIDPRGITNGVTFDPVGRPVATTNALGQVGQTVVRTFYDSAGRVAWSVDPAGVTNAFGYDALGRQTSVTNAWGTTVALVSVTSYDAEGRPTNQVQFAGTSAAVTNRTQYDALGRSTQVIRAFDSPDTSSTRTVYDSAGRVVQSIDPRGVTNAFGYDALGRRWAVTNAWGTPLAQVITNAYDAAGNLTGVTHVPSSQTTEYRYDALNRRIQTILPAVVAGGPRTTNAVGYDAGGRKVAETNGLAGSGHPGVVKRFAYDPLGRLLAVTNGWNSTGIAGLVAATNWTTFGYDAAGNLLRQVDALNRTNTYEYDPLGRRRIETMPGGQWIGYGYDVAGRLTTRTNADGIRVRYAYDTLGRLTNQWTLTTGGVSNHVAALSYGPSGLLTNRLDASGTHRWVHDILGRLRTNVTPVGTLRYTYDAAGNQLTLASTTTDGVDLSYQYDALGRLTNAVDQRLTTANKNTAYGFEAAGNLSWVNYRPISVTNSHSYDGQNRLTSLAWRTTGGTALASFTYTVHTLGMRTALSETVTNVARTYTWGYDALHRLKSEALTGSVSGTIDYGHDLVGNRTNRTAALGLASQSLNYDVNDWLDADGVTNNANGQFDAKGNTTNYTGVTYGYDWDNRLTSSSAGGFSAAYDLEGNRTRKTAGGVTTHFLVATVNPTGWPQVVEEHTGTNPGTLSRRYTYGADLISQSRWTGSVWDTHFFLTDGLGSTRALLNSSGGISDTYTYDAFGNQIASTGTTPNHYRYTGEQWDNELGMYYLRARYMSPMMGRFWSRDTFEGHPTDPLSLHRYLYCHANPVNGVDPSGHEFSLTGMLVTSANIGRTAAQVGFAVAQAYNRATAAYDAIQDVALVAGILGDGEVDEEESEILFGLIDDYVRSRVQAHALRVVSGVGGRALGAAAGAAGRMRITQAGIQRTREWYRKHKADWAGKSRNTAAGPVNYDQHGWPDFSPYLRQGGVNTVQIKLTGSRGGDFDLADQAAGVSAAWRQANGYVWHHHQKLGTMQLVKKAAHTTSDGGAPHAGGVALYKRLYGSGYE